MVMTMLKFNKKLTIGAYKTVDSTSQSTLIVLLKKSHHKLNTELSFLIHMDITVKQKIWLWSAFYPRLEEFDL